MKTRLLTVVSAILISAAAPASAIQCVPYAREISGINLKGDAWQWWHAAAGVYDRGAAPKDGAVLVFSRQGSMRYGHVSVITRVMSNRVVLVDHANWAPVRTSGRGAVSHAVPVMDVSPKNDWSQVRVWYAPNNDFGSRVYKADGFVYQPQGTAIARPGIHKAALSRATLLFPDSQLRPDERKALKADAARFDTTGPTQFGPAESITVLDAVPEPPARKMESAAKDTPRAADPVIAAVSEERPEQRKAAAPEVVPASTTVQLRSSADGLIFN